MLIGLCGLPGNGKGTVAYALASRHGFKHMKFASPLKDMLRTMLRHGGLCDEEIEQMIEGHLKELPHPALKGKTPRWAMQSLGTEWGRDCIDEGIWGDIWEAGAHVLLENGKSVCVDDVRFPNEYERLRRMGGFTVLIEGRSQDKSEHRSDDMSFMTFDYTITNDGSLAHLDEKVDQLVKEIREHVWE